MSDLQSGSSIYVVVDSVIEGQNPASAVHGVYSSEKAAKTAAYHPYSSLKVLRLYLDSIPVNEADDIDEENSRKEASERP